MSENIKELVKRLREERKLTWRDCNEAAAALEAMAGEVDSLKQAVEAEKDEQARMEFHHMHALADLAAERDRLAGEVGRWKQSAANAVANEAAAEAERDKFSAETARYIMANGELKLERDRLKAVLRAIEQGDYYGCVSEFAAKALGGDE